MQPNHLADDYMLGRLVHRHELRWARTFRTLRPLFTFGIPVSLAWLAVSLGNPLAGVAVIAHVGLRCLGRMVLSPAVGREVRWRDAWLVPVRDVLSFGVGLASFLGRTVPWNDAALHVHPDGRLEPRPHANAPARASLASKWEESA